MVVYKKLNRLDRGAVRISTFWPWQGSCQKGKGSPPKRKAITPSLPLGRQRISAGLSQDFVKRYQWLFGVMLQEMPYFHGPLTKAVQFLFCRGMTTRKFNK